MSGPVELSFLEELAPMQTLILLLPTFHPQEKGILLFILAKQPKQQSILNDLRYPRINHRIKIEPPFIIVPLSLMIPFCMHEERVPMSSIPQPKRIEPFLSNDWSSYLVDIVIEVAICLKPTVKVQLPPIFELQQTIVIVHSKFATRGESGIHRSIILHNRKFELNLTRTRYLPLIILMKRFLNLHLRPFILIPNIKADQFLMIPIPLKKGIIPLLVNRPFLGVVKVGHDICLVINNKKGMNVWLRIAFPYILL